MSEIKVCPLCGSGGFDGSEEVEAADHEPIHGWFGLSYSNYLVIPRSILQSAPVEIQRRLVAILNELDELFGHVEERNVTYEVRVRGDGGHFKRDPLADYERGRRRIETAGLVPPGGEEEKG